MSRQQFKRLGVLGLKRLGVLGADDDEVAVIERRDLRDPAAFGGGITQASTLPSGRSVAGNELRDPEEIARGWTGSIVRLPEARSPRK